MLTRHAPAAQIAGVPSGDADLVRRARARDEAAVRAIMQANNRRLYRIARGILRNDGEAEDVVQETYLRAFTHLESFRGDSSLATWLARIAMNEALGRLRRQRPSVELSTLRPGALDAQIIQFPNSAAAEDPEKTMAQREIQHVVEHAIDDLPEAFRIVFITRVLEGMNVEETAELLDIKPETVKTRLHRARAMLKENVERKIGPVVLEAFPFAGKRCEPDRGGFEAARPVRVISGTFAPARHPTPVFNQQRRRFMPIATGVPDHVRSIERGGRRG